jgi:hypothetical protein
MSINFNGILSVRCTMAAPLIGGKCHKNEQHRFVFAPFPRPQSVAPAGPIHGLGHVASPDTGRGPSRCHSRSFPVHFLIAVVFLNNCKTSTPNFPRPLFSALLQSLPVLGYLTCRALWTNTVLPKRYLFHFDDLLVEIS